MDNGHNSQGSSGSIFGQEVKPVGMYENVATQTQVAPGQAMPVEKAAAENPFDTGTDPVAPAMEEQGQPPEATASGDKDAYVRVFVDSTRMTAQVQVEAPLGAGEHLTKDMLSAALAKNNIVHGFVEEGLAKVLLPTYDDRIVVAEGTPPVDGEDGVCKELFEREVVTEFQEREDGSVDYRELGLIRDVKPGATICEVTPPTEGEFGTNVSGTQLKPKPGKKAALPIGEGTQASQDGTRVEAVYGGNLVFRGGRFCVDKVVRVQNVNYDVGNITFSGDVQVNGDIQDGFEIRAGGNVTLQGQIGAVTIVAGGDIIIEKGVNGTGRAVLEAGKNLRAGFIENCIVRVGENLSASSIINSQVECEGEVDVTKSKGIICGGKITSFGSIKANEVGNEFNTLTVIALGVTPKLLKERKKLQDQLGDVTAHIDEMQKNVAYIERLVADGRPIPPERLQLLQRSKLQLPMTEKKQAQLSESIAAMEAKMSEVNTSTLSAKTIHPPTKISIGALSTNCIETRNMCRVYKSSTGELVFGSY